MKTILVIEDKTEVRENLAEILELAQYRVIQAADGRKGVELARSDRPDLILCDIMMPELDGYGVLHILGKDPDTAGIPFIFLTARIDPAQIRSGMNLGADDYLTKPIDDVDLLHAVELRLKKSQQSRSQSTIDGLAGLLEALQQPAGTSYPCVRFAKKQLLYAEGNGPMALYFIQYGQLKRVKTDPQGNTLITALSKGGDFVGLAALLLNMPYTESAELLTDAQVCTLPKAEFLRLLTSHPDIAAYFMRLLAIELTQRDERLLLLAYQPVRKRVAEALLLVQRTFYSPADAVGTDQLPPSQLSLTNPAMSLSRENWSQLVGASPETVIRVLGDLRTEGMLELSGSQITLLDSDRLARLKH
ncbi:response regulator [Spirosoma sp. HMF4905]|uniref:Response regulator n=1 Tax=Spirosoma arboris TaxID=2682092 RepID=A0A7K1SEB6_9BACT|nr:response regulator [Spirosoma arboris]MVM32142.1 response regulator [Spirosoma arboris]